MSNVNLKPVLIEELQHFYFVFNFGWAAMLAEVDIKFDSGSSEIVWSLLETINLLISIQNVEKWSQHEEERKDKAASWGTEEDAETFPPEGDVLPRYIEPVTPERFIFSLLPGKVVAEQPDLCGDSSGQQSKPTSRLHTTTSKLSRIL